jgi:Ca2+-binding EF-hand superfamily protein
MKTIAALVAVILAAGAGIIWVGSSDPDAPDVSMSARHADPNPVAATNVESTPASKPARRVEIRDRPKLAESAEPKLSDEERRQARRQRFEDRRKRMRERFDSNRDGDIDQDERRAMREARRERRRARDLEWFDENGDGRLDDDELAMRDQAREDRRADRQIRMMNRIDSNSDGKISAQELDQGGGRMRRIIGDFDSADTNKDGHIDTDELDTAFTARRQRWRQRGGEQGQDERSRGGTD